MKVNLATFLVALDVLPIFVISTIKVSILLEMFITLFYVFIVATERIEVGRFYHVFDICAALFW